MLKGVIARVFNGANNGTDEGQIEQIIYNPYAGAQKNLAVGPFLEGIAYENAGAMAYTTNATTAKKIIFGSQIMVFNNNAAVQNIRLSGEATVPVAVGAIGDVGPDFCVIPCRPGEWAIMSLGPYNMVLASHADLKVYVIKDDTKYATLSEK